MSKANLKYGMVSAIGTYVLMAIIALKTGVFPMVIQELSGLLTGNISNIVMQDAGFLSMFPVIFATVVISLPFALVSGILQNMILGRPVEHAVTDMMENPKDTNMFMIFFLLVLGEEIFARWLFLGLVPSWFSLTSAGAFYLIFLLGNSIWALMHLLNFKGSDRNPLRVLPQFVAGIFFTYIYMKHGLLASVLGHFAYNAVLFSMHKIQNIDWVDMSIVAYGLILSLVSYFLLQKPISDVALWFSDNPSFILPGWGFWDYFMITTFLTAMVIVVFGLLFYDRPRAGKQIEVPTYQEIIVGSIVVVITAIVLFEGLGIFMDSVPARILMLAVSFSFLTKCNTGSGMSRIFWTSLPLTYVTICVVQALHFWVIPLLVLQFVVFLPQKMLIVRDN